MTGTAPAVDNTFGVPADEARLDRAVAALQANGFVVEVVDTAQDARKLVGQLVPADQSVFTTASETLRQSGIAADLDESGEFRSLRAAAGDVSDDMHARIRLGATPDIAVGSVHALTEQGHAVVASASGSQFGPYASGARTVIWVVGSQKIVPDLETALRRIRTHSYPLEWRRMHALNGRGSVLSKLLIVEREVFAGRTTIVLIREAIGF